MYYDFISFQFLNDIPCCCSYGLVLSLMTFTFLKNICCFPLCDSVSTMKRSYNFCSLAEDETYNKVTLVERNPEPFGHKLINVSSTFKALTAELAELSEEVEKADTFSNAVAVNRLELIAEQMKFLQNQACKVVVELRQGLTLHHVACNFKKVSGKIYHLYQRPSGQKYFSMLSPEEWTIPHQFLGSFRLENDMTWTPVEKLEEKERKLNMINNIVTANQFTQSEQFEIMSVEGNQNEHMSVDI